MAQLCWTCQQNPDPSGWSACYYCRKLNEHYLPPEMVPQFFTKPPVIGAQEWGTGFSNAEEEMLQVLAEECAETIQRVTKLLRFGKRSNPWNSKDSMDEFHKELADVAAATEALVLLGIVDEKKICEYAAKKLKAFVVEENPQRPRLRFAGPLLKSRGAFITALRWLKDLGVETCTRCGGTEFTPFERHWVNRDKGRACNTCGAVKK